MTTSVDPTTREQQRTKEQPTARPPGWRPDGHTGPSDWMTIVIVLAIIALALIVSGVWSATPEPSVELTPPVGDAYELEQVGPFAVATAPTPGDTVELERLGVFTYQLNDVASAQGDASELERLGPLVTVTAPGDASELERLG